MKVLLPVLRAGILSVLLLFTAHISRAGSARWRATPATNDWNTAGNWTPATVPNGSSDTATFATSSITALSLSASTEVNSIIFNSGASPYTITNYGVISYAPSFTISGAGIINNSGITQNFVAGRGCYLNFTNTATAGTLTAFDLQSPDVSNGEGGYMNFTGSSTAGSSNITIEGSAFSDLAGGAAAFYDTSNLDNANFTVNGGSVVYGYWGVLALSQTSTNNIAGNFMLNGGTAGAATGSVTEFSFGTGADITGDFTIGGGTTSDANGPAGGATFTMLCNTVDNIDGKWTIGGGTNGGSPAYVAIYPPTSISNIDGDWTIDGSTITNVTYGGYLLFAPAAVGDIKGNWLFNGGAVANSAGGYVDFGPGVVSSITGTWTIAGGAASGAYGAYFNTNSQHYNSGINIGSISGDWTIGGGAASQAGGGTVYLTPDSIISIDGNWTIGGATAGAFSSGTLYFAATSGGCAINGNITVNGSAVSGIMGGYAAITAAGPVTGGGSFTANGGTVAGALGGVVYCPDQDSGARTYTANGGRGSGASGGTIQLNFQPGVNGTLVANGGTSGGGGGFISVYQCGNASIPRLQTAGNGVIDLSEWSAAATSIQGTGGSILLGSSSFVVGSDNLSTIYAGSLKDGGLSGGTRASLTKLGTGTLTLTGSSTYTGPTTVTGGTLLVSNTRGSGTGTGPVTVSRSTLGGTGIISGTVSIGGNSGARAFLAPGNSGVGVLTTKKSIKLNKTATYNCELDSNTATADKVSAKGVSINSLAQIALSDLGTTVLTPGTVFTIIDNTAATTINGAFGNLADASTVTVGNNTYLVSYEGGTGNDLTLTVVQ